MQGRINTFSRKFINLSALALAVSLAAWGGARAWAAAAASAELARIDNRVITLEEFNKRYQDNLKFFQNAAPPRKSVLNDLVNREVGVLEARKLGLDKDPEVQDRMNTVLYQVLLEKKIGKEADAIEVSDDDAAKFYATNPEIRTSHIFIAVRPEASSAEEAEARKKIMSTLALLKDPHASFAEVAQKYSEGMAAANGGDIDYMTRENLDPHYYEAAVALKVPGKITQEPVRSQFGWHIIKLTAIRPWEETDKVKVKRMLHEERKLQLYEKFMEQLRKQHHVVLHPELIK